MIEYCVYLITGKPKQIENGRWITSVEISKYLNGKLKKCTFDVEKCSSYILEIEAEKESENLGKCMIDRNMIEF
jgi:hypothetical protein